MSDATPTPPPSAPDRGMRWVLLLIVVSLLWYLLADRVTPYTQQARLQAYVVPVSAEVAGQVKRVAVGNNQEVRKGDVLFELDQEQYRIALARAEADLDTVRRQIGAHTAGIDSAQAALVAAQANERKARQDAERLKRLIDEDPGTVSVRRLEGAQASRDQAISQVAAARAEVERAREQQGGAQDDNAQLRSAAANVEKARLDLARTMAPDLPHRVVGIRPGEKLHEIMITEDDARQTVELSDRYVIEPAFNWWDRGSYAKHDANPVPDGFSYRSDTNPHWLTGEEMLALLDRPA